MEIADEEQKVPEIKNNSQCNAEVVQVNGKDDIHSKPVKRKRDNDDDDSSNAETQFNEDLLCQHGMFLKNVSRSITYNLILTIICNSFLISLPIYSRLFEYRRK